jgi:hypothetical protein
LKGNHNTNHENEMPEKQKKTWLYPHERNHPEHSQEVIDWVDNLAREFSGYTWPNEIRERKTAWRRAYGCYQHLVITRKDCPDLHKGMPEPTADTALLIYTADLRHYRRPYPVYVAPVQCVGGSLKLPDATDEQAGGMPSGEQ